MKQSQFEVISNEALSPMLNRLRLRGDTSAIERPGQFVNVELDGLFLRRPFSVCDRQGDVLTVLVKRVGRGTELICALKPGEALDLLTGLGNGFDLSVSGDRPLLIGGGSGIPPMYMGCKKLIAEGKHPIAALGFNSSRELFYVDELEALGAEVIVLTADGSAGIRGLATDAIDMTEHSFVYACGPLPMLMAIEQRAKTDAQFSLEARMGCGFGACMGCTIETTSGPKRVCKDGPVFRKGEIVW